MRILPGLPDTSYIREAGAVPGAMRWRPSRAGQPIWVIIADLRTRLGCRTRRASSADDGAGQHALRDGRIVLQRVEQFGRLGLVPQDRVAGAGLIVAVRDRHSA